MKTNIRMRDSVNARNITKFLPNVVLALSQATLLAMLILTAGYLHAQDLISQTPPNVNVNGAVNSFAVGIGQENANIGVRNYVNVGSDNNASALFGLNLYTDSTGGNTTLRIARFHETMNAAGIVIPGNGQWTDRQGGIDFYTSSSAKNILAGEAYPTNGSPSMSILPNGNVRVSNNSGANYLMINDGTRLLQIGVDNTVPGYAPNGLAIVSAMNNHGLVFRTQNTARFTIDASGNIIVGDGVPDPALGKFNVQGTMSSRVLTITGGSDLSEKFEVGGQKSPEPGMVVAIDPSNPGKLVISAQAYNRRVAGILSGAGGVQPGMLMGHAGTIADGAHPVALTGRVYAWADASNGPIQPGDLLTSSATPGHAMKVKDYARAQGAIIGKAMTGLQQGKGLVLVLVTLQ